MPAAPHPGRRPVGVAGMDPRPLGVGRIDRGEGPLEPEGSLRRPDRGVEHLVPDPEGMARQAVVSRDTVAA